MLEFAGIEAEQLHQYPYGRQVLGPAVFAREVSFDCSSSGLHRHFWRAHHTSPTKPPPSPRQQALLVVESVAFERPLCVCCRHARKLREMLSVRLALLTRGAARRDADGRSAVIVLTCDVA